MLPIRPRSRAPRRVSSRLPRTAVGWWLGFLTLTALTGLLVQASIGRAEAAEARWGPSRSVLVATAAIAVGEPIDRASTALEGRPVASVPIGAFPELPRGRVAVTAIVAGEVVIAARISGERSAGVAALLPPGTRALLVPLEVAGLPVREGDRVDLLATGVGGPSGDLPTAGNGPIAVPEEPVAENALVVAVQRDALVVAVPGSSAPGVAAALGQGAVVPALTPPAG